MSLVGYSRDILKEQEADMNKEWDAVEFFNSLGGLKADSAIRALAAEAERRGMLKAGWILHERLQKRYGWDKYDDVAAIERAAKGEG